MHLNNILILPDEIIANILKYTDYKTVIACRRSCRRFNEVVEASSALRYIIELAASGMCDGPPNDIVPAERLRRLSGMQTAWKTSAWTLVDDFPYSREMSPDPILASGNLVAFWGSGSRMSELILLRFPSKSRGIPEQIWYLDLDCNDNDLGAFCADDSQDLLVCSCSTTICVRTLSTGGIHPLTTNGGTIHPRPIPGGFSLCIHGDLVLILLGLSSSVWDWKTGEEIATIPFTTSSFSFLDRNHIISMHRNFSPPRTFAFQVTTLPDVAGEAPSHTYHFLLPPSIAVPSYSIALHANTLPTSWSRRRSSSAHDPAGCFHADPDEKLLAFVLGSDTEMRMTSSILHVPHATFLSHIAELRACAPDESAATAATAAPVVVVPWRAWGPGRTYLTTVPDVYQWNLCGYRACGMHALGVPHLLLDRGILRITDHHPHRVARARARAAATTVPVGSGDDDQAAAAAEAEGGGEEERNDHDTPRGEPPRGGCVQIPYVEKDIPLPDGPRSGHVRCILGEDVVVLLEFAAGDPENPAYRIKKIYYHPI